MRYVVEYLMLDGRHIIHSFRVFDEVGLANLLLLEKQGKVKVLEIIEVEEYEGYGGR